MREATTLRTSHLAAATALLLTLTLVVPAGTADAPRTETATYYPAELVLLPRAYGCDWDLTACADIHDGDDIVFVELREASGLPGSGLVWFEDEDGHVLNNRYWNICHQSGFVIPDDAARVGFAAEAVLGPTLCGAFHLMPAPSTVGTVTFRLK